ncbi:MAG: signal peptidase II [Clostridia bacterium]|nr:signal peptidase II [Clostridia bacterium]
MYIWLIILIAAIAADQATKLLTVAKLDLGSSFDLIHGVFRFTYIRNEGAAFGMLSEHRWVFLVLSTVAIVGIIIYVIKNPPKSKVAMLSLTLIVAGGIGNMIDRVRLGYVIDFLDFYAFPFWKWIFNVADACVCVGAALMMLWLIAGIVKDAKAAKNAPAAQSDAGKSESDIAAPENADESEERK